MSLHQLPAVFYCCHSHVFQFEFLRKLTPIYKQRITVLGEQIIIRLRGATQEVAYWHVEQPLNA